MKFMEKAKRFFTLKRRANDGFTLVELIVVIAILAILAGVAVPAYSGYIEKSKRAGDETLLAAVNKAFASACLDQGTEIYLLNPSTHGQPAVTIVDGAVTAVTPFGDAFALYYEGNENAKFQTITSVVFDWSTYMFVDPQNAPGGQVTVTYAGSQITVSSETLKALKESTYGQRIGASKLLDQVGTVTGVASTMAGSLSAVFADQDFRDVAMNALNASTTEEYYAKSSALVSTLVNEYGMTPEAAQNQVNTNAAVLYASKYAADYSEDQITALFAGGSAAVKENLKTDGNTADGMAQAALVYGMYTAYANSAEYGSSALQANANDPLAVLNAMDNDENFIKFVNSEQGKMDMQAYQSALGVIVDSTDGNEAATTDLMLNGYNNPALKDVISGLMG